VALMDGRQPGACSPATDERPKVGELYRPRESVSRDVVLWVVLRVDAWATYQVEARRCDPVDQDHVGRWRFDVFSEAFERVVAVPRSQPAPTWRPCLFCKDKVEVPDVGCDLLVPVCGACQRDRTKAGACSPACAVTLLAELRADGWEVAVHNDYRQDGQPHTFWLFTRGDRRWIKGEGTTDEFALRAALAESQRPDTKTGLLQAKLDADRENIALRSRLTAAEERLARQAELADTTSAMVLRLHERERKLNDDLSEEAANRLAAEERVERLRVTNAELQTRNENIHAAKESLVAQVERLRGLVERWVGSRQVVDPAARAALVEESRKEMK
jgi:cell division protein FtsB